MFDIFFGWRKASKCKKLIKKVQCRLKLLKNKRFAIARQLKEDIAQLLNDGHDHIAFSRLDQLYMDESLMSVYEMLDNFSEFIILNLSYIRRHKDIPNDIKEAVSTLIFASARFGDLPELRLVRKLFSERYGQRFATSAVESHPGSLVNLLVKDKLTPQQIPEDVKNRLLDEIMRDYFFKPGPLALKYKPEFHAQPEKITGFGQVEQRDRVLKDINTSPNCAIVLQSSPASRAETPKGQIVANFTQLSPPQEHKSLVRYSSESPTQYPEESMIYLDDVQEFKSPTKQGLHCQDDQDQRFFVFKSSWMYNMERPKAILESNKDEHDKNLTRKRMRRRSVSREKPIVNDAPCEIYYSNRRQNQRKYRKKIEIGKEKGTHLLDYCECRHRCSLDRPCYFYTNDDKDYEIELWRDKYGVEKVVEYHVSKDEIEEMGSISPLPQTPKRDFTASPNLMRDEPPPPYTRAATMPQRQEMMIRSKEISRTNSFPVEKIDSRKEYNGGRDSASPRHVHPKLPDYDQIAAKFMELKKVYQQNKYIKC